MKEGWVAETCLSENRGCKWQGCGPAEGPDRRRLGGRCCSPNMYTRSRLGVPLRCTRLKKRREGGGDDRMVRPLIKLAAKITCWNVGGRRSQPCVYLYASRCAATKGRSASAFCKRVATSLRNPVSLEWYCGMVLWRVACCFRFLYYHWQKRLVALLSSCSKRGAVITCGDLRATAWRNTRPSLQLAAITTLTSHTITSFADIVFNFYF